MQDRFELSVRRLGLEDPEALRSAKRAHAESEITGDMLVKRPGHSGADTLRAARS
jgi:hypothetical protein